MKGETVILIECTRCRHRLVVDVTDNETNPSTVEPMWSNIRFTGNGIWGTCNDCARDDLKQWLKSHRRAR